MGQVWVILEITSVFLPFSLTLPTFQIGEYSGSLLPVSRQTSDKVGLGRWKSLEPGGRSMTGNQNISNGFLTTQEAAAWLGARPALKRPRAWPGAGPGPNFRLQDGPTQQRSWLCRRTLRKPSAQTSAWEGNQHGYKKEWVQITAREGS